MNQQNKNFFRGFSIFLEVLGMMAIAFGILGSKGYLVVLGMIALAVGFGIGWPFFKDTLEISEDDLIEYEEDKEKNNST